MAYKFKIEKIYFKNSVEIIPKKINVFIGPNSSGKSQSLKDIRDIMRGANSQARPTKIVDRLDFQLPDSADSFIASYIPDTELYAPASEGQAFTKTYSGLSNESYNHDNSIRSLTEDQSSRVYLGSRDGWKEELSSLLTEGDRPNRKEEFIARYGRLFMVYTGTKEKLMVIERSSRCGSNEQETNLLSDFNVEDGRLSDLYDDVKSLFHREIILDKSAVQFGRELVFRTGEPDSHLSQIDERELYNYPLLEEDGDGIKDYTAVYLTLKVQNKNVILVDDILLHIVSVFLCVAIFVEHWRLGIPQIV